MAKEGSNVGRGGARTRPRDAPRDLAGKTRVRMYQQGLGDCFLLTFPAATPGRDGFHVLIDCGVILGTPGAASLLKSVAEDIAETTGKHLDVLVATHEHWDHVAGFHPAAGLFRGFTIDQVWLAWTEDPTDETARRLRRDREARLTALWRGAVGLRDRLEKMAKQARDGGASVPLGLDAAVRRAESAAGVLSFFGIDPSEGPPPRDGALGAAAQGSKTGAAMEWVRAAGKRQRYFRPGEVVSLPAGVDVRVYVLGPPTDLKRLTRSDPTRSGHQTYEVLAAAERAFFAGPGIDPFEVEFAGTVPFDRKYRIDRDDAGEIDFFRDHYFGGGSRDNFAWRRIDGAWTGASSALALQLDSDTNNTSLALAFELPDRRVLLFPGDAQVGNWESWHTDEDGHPRIWSSEGRTQVTAPQLLAQTALYKVGHHGSHNATLRAKGLEMMTREDLVAMVPVDEFIAHEKKGWTQMPFSPLMARLDEVTRGRVIQADRPLGSVPGLDGRASASRKTLKVDVSSDGQTEDRPLYVDYLV
jgi:hypothetical protein